MNTTLPRVLHQSLSLTVDTNKQLLRGHTELKLSCSAHVRNIGVHAYKLNVTAVTVNGEEASYGLRPYVGEELPESIQKGPYESAQQAAANVADHTYFQYEGMLQKEAEPELVIQLPASMQSAHSAATQGGLLILGGAQRELLVRIQYDVAQPQSGMHFAGEYAHTDNQVRRARAWLPCVDTPTHACPFDLHLTVGAHQVAVSGGLLQKQTLSQDGEWKTFHYQLERASPACDLGLAVGPFAVVVGAPLVSSHVPLDSPTASPVHPSAEAASAVDTVTTYFGPASQMPLVDHTMKVFPQIFSLYETFLGEKFPYGMLQQAFIPAEAASNPSQVAAGMHLFSTDLLFNERCIEQAIESRCAIAKALARQWFGVFIRPKTAGDAWLLEGLAGYLADQYVRRFMGRNEWLYRKHKERKAIFLADDGSAPHLFLKGLDIYHWGLLYGTERLDPSGLRAWKATAVMNMLAVRAGEDNLRKVMRNIMSAACKQSPTGDGQTDGNARLISTREFLHNVGKQGGCRKEVGAFGERWIVGRGCPRITAAFAYNKRANLLEVAARQEGSLAARKTTEKANTAALREGSSIGLIKLAVRETDGLAEHTIQIGTQRYSLAEEIKVTSKPGARKMKKRGGQEEDLPEEASRTPILWVRLDPSGETLADIHMYQPEFMWAAQLGMSRDVVAQSLAIRGLAEMRPASPGVLNILRSCLENDMVYCRIRIEAAMALAHSRGDGHRSQGLDHLIAYFRQRCFDPEVQQIRPNRFEDLAEHFVSQALPVAISLARHPSGHSPPEAVDLLVDVAKYEDNRGNIYDDSNFLAAIVQALGNLRPSSREALMRIVKQLDRLLAREQVLPSFHSVVASAVLSALTQLATSATAHGARELVPGLMRLFTQFTLPSVHHSLRRTAYRCCVQLTASTAGLDAAVQLANDAVAAEPLPAVRSAILEDLLQVQLTLTISPALTSNASAEVSMATLVQLQQRLTAHDDPRLRHRAFMVLQRLAGAPPTLFREKEDEEPSMAGPSMSLDTRQRGRPEASAPALSMDSERVVLRLKPGKTGTQMSPSPHKGRASEGGSDERTVAGGEVRSPLQPTPPARVVQRTDSPTRLKIRTTPESGPSGAAKPIIARFSLKPSGSLSGGLPPAGAAPSLSAGTPAAGAVQRSSDGARTQSPGQAATYKTQSAGEAAPEAAVDQLPAPVQPGPSVAHRSHVQELGRQPLADQPAAAETPRLGRIVLKHGQGFAGSPAVPAAAVGPASAAGVQAGPSVKAEGQPQAKPEVDASGSVFTFGTGSVPAGIPAGPPFTMGQPEQKAARHNPKATSRKSKMPPVGADPAALPQPPPPLPAQPQMLPPQAPAPGQPQQYAGPAVQQQQQAPAAKPPAATVPDGLPLWMKMADKRAAAVVGEAPAGKAQRSKPKQPKQPKALPPLPPAAQAAPSAQNMQGMPAAPASTPFAQPAVQHLGMHAQPPPTSAAAPVPYQPPWPAPQQAAQQAQQAPAQQPAQPAPRRLKIKALAAPFASGAGPTEQHQLMQQPQLLHPPNLITAASTTGAPAQFPSGGPALPAQPPVPQQAQQGHPPPAKRQKTKKDRPKAGAAAPGGSAAVGPTYGPSEAMLGAAGLGPGSSTSFLQPPPRQHPGGYPGTSQPAAVGRPLQPSKPPAAPGAAAAPKPAGGGLKLKLGGLKFTVGGGSAKAADRIGSASQAAPPQHAGPAGQAAPAAPLPKQPNVNPAGQPRIPTAPLPPSAVASARMPSPGQRTAQYAQHPALGAQVAQHPQQAQRQPGPTFSVGAVSGSDSGKRKREMTADQLTEYKRAKKEGKDKRKQEETEEEKAERRRLKKAKKDRKGRERSGSAIEQI